MAVTRDFKLDNLRKLFGRPKKFSEVSAGRDDAQVVALGDDDLDALPPERPLTREQRQREQLTKVRERERKQFERYERAREYRLCKLQDQYPQIIRYFRALDKVKESGEAERTAKYDCDVDLAELACRCGVDALESDSDRWFIYELTSEWVFSLGKYGWNYPISEDEDLFADPFRDTALGELKQALRLK